MRDEIREGDRDQGVGESGPQLCERGCAPPRLPCRGCRSCRSSPTPTKQSRMKIVSVSRMAAVRPRPASAKPFEGPIHSTLEGALLSAVEGRGGDRGDHNPRRAWNRRPSGRCGQRPPAAEPAVLYPEHAQPSEHAEINREDLSPFGTRSLHRTGPSSSACSRCRPVPPRRRRVGRDRPRLPARPVDDLQPDQRQQPDRSGPATEPLRIGEMSGPLSRDCREGPAEYTAHRPPGVEGPEDVAEEDTDRREAQPGGDEHERQGEIAVGRFGSPQPGIDREPQQEDADSPAHDLRRQTHTARENPAPRAAIVRPRSAASASRPRARRRRRSGRSTPPRRRARPVSAGPGAAPARARAAERGSRVDRQLQRSGPTTPELRPRRHLRCPPRSRAQPARPLRTPSSGRSRERGPRR